MKLKLNNNIKKFAALISYVIPNIPDLAKTSIIDVV